MANDPDVESTEQIEPPEEDTESSTDQKTVEELDAGDASTSDDGTTMPPPNPDPPGG